MMNVSMCASNVINVVRELNYQSVKCLKITQKSLKNKTQLIQVMRFEISIVICLLIIKILNPLIFTFKCNILRQS